MFRLLSQGKSWSGYERNCCFLNTGSQRFACISATSGLDFQDDGRAVVQVDWDQDGDLDLWISNRTAPRLRFLKNNGSHGNYQVSDRHSGTLGRSPIKDKFHHPPCAFAGELEPRKAHLATVVNADRIAVIEGGRILSMGTHGELMDNCELYARLAAMQFDPDLTLDNLTAARKAVG